MSELTRKVDLLIASPFLVAAFKTGWNKTLKVSAWLMIEVIFIGLLLYHSNGKDQINACRYTLDFLPIMLVMAGLGAKMYRDGCSGEWFFMQSF